MRLFLLPNGGEIKHATATVPFEYIEDWQNYKIMLDCKKVAEGTCKLGHPFEVLQSDNRNVITVVHGGYVKHIHLEDIIGSILDSSPIIKKVNNVNVNVSQPDGVHVGSLVEDK